METDAVLTLLQDVAAAVVTPRFGRLSGGDVTSKRRPGDLVTVADREAETLLTEALRRQYPEALVLGEEAAAADPTLLRRFRCAEHAFTLDPVDGTRNFVKHSPDHAVMAAEVRRGEVVRSWIWQPQHATAYVAEVGAGAWRNGRRLRRAPVEGTLIDRISRGGWLSRAVAASRNLQATWTCCGVDYPRVAEGLADVALYRKSRPWDHAPGSLLLSEAGGYVGTVAGEPYRPQSSAPSGIVAAADRATYELVRRLWHAVPGW